LGKGRGGKGSRSEVREEKGGKGREMRQERRFH